MRRSRIFTPLAMEKLRSSSSRSPSGRKAPSVMSKSPLRLTVKTPLCGPSMIAAKMLPCLVEALFRDHDQPALVLAVGIGMGDGLEAAILAQLRARHQEIQLPERRLHVVRLDPELGDAVVALETDRGDAVLDREAFGIDLPFLARSAGRPRRPSAACGNSGCRTGVCRRRGPRCRRTRSRCRRRR